MPVSVTLTGLSAGTTFHYMLCANERVEPLRRRPDVRDEHAADGRARGRQTSGPTPLIVTFDGSASHDALPGSLATWTLTFGDGQSTGGTGTPLASIQHTYSNACSCVATLTVTDNQGTQNSTNVGIHPTTNQPPIASLSASPATSGTVPLDVSFNGSGSYDPDGDSAAVMDARLPRREHAGFGLRPRAEPDPAHVRGGRHLPPGSERH